MFDVFEADWLALVSSAVLSWSPLSIPEGVGMKVMQTRFGGPKDALEDQGNCFAACVATLFNKSLESVEHYTDGIETVKRMESRWWEYFVRWSIEELGYIPLYLSWGEKASPEMYAWGKPGMFYIACGPSPRGLAHSVVYCDGELFHDPHPSGLGLESVDSYIIFTSPIRIGT